MTGSQTTKTSQEAKIIVVCENCSQKLRLPKRRKRLSHVTCPTCRHKFDYRYYGLGFSSNSKKPLPRGSGRQFDGICPGRGMIEASHVIAPFRVVLSAIVTLGVFSACLGAVMGAAEGFLKKNRARLSEILP